MVTVLPVPEESPAFHSLPPSHLLCLRSSTSPLSAQPPLPLFLSHQLSFTFSATYPHSVLWSPEPCSYLQFPSAPARTSPPRPRCPVPPLLTTPSPEFPPVAGLAPFLPRVFLFLYFASLPFPQPFISPSHFLPLSCLLIHLTPTIPFSLSVRFLVFHTHTHVVPLRPFPVTPQPSPFPQHP